MSDDIDRRLDAVERAITGGDRAVADLADAAEVADRVDAVEERTDHLEQRLADLEAAVRALRGYLGHERVTDERSTTDPSADDRRGAPAHSTDDTRRIDADANSGWSTGDDHDDTRDGPTDRGDSVTADDDRATSDDGRGVVEQPGESDEAAAWDWATAADGDDLDRQRRGDDTERRARRDRPDGRARDGSSPSPEGRLRDDERAVTDGAREPRSTDRWPGPDDGPVDDRRPETSEDWPGGLDVDRAQPWSVPDPPQVAPDEGDEDGLLDRLREAL